MTALRLYLLRHGEPGASNMFYGHADIPLSERGELQALTAARSLAHLPLAAIYASDLRRAARGAELLAALGDARPTPVLLPALREMHLGVLEQLSFADARLRAPDLATRRYDDMLHYRMPGGGESVLDLAARVLPCIAELVARHARTTRLPTPPPALALVAHNTVNRVLLACAAGLGPAGYPRFEQAFGAISRIDFPDHFCDADLWNNTRIGLLNWSPHALGEIRTS